MSRIWWVVMGLFVVMGIGAWATDFVTLQGECTVYTVDCRDGRWEGDRCTGALVPADRFRFRALKPHREVLYWTVGSTRPSGRYSECEIQDGRNWRCSPQPKEPETITLAMAHGEPLADPLLAATTLRPVHKLRWLLLRAGVPTGHRADMPST